MSYIKRLDHAFENAPMLPINASTRYVFFSDCHRGIGGDNDNFLPNAGSYLSALQYYYPRGFTYIEVGDGDELWENFQLSEIMETYKDIFTQLFYFHQAGRLYMLYGNHDMEKKDAPGLFENQRFHEGIILKSPRLPANLYVTHGHQAEFLNSVLWKLSRFLVRYFWTPLEAIGVRNPTSASQSSVRKKKLESRYLDYAQNRDILFLAGHTHKAVLGNRQSPYYNCGCCVHPNCITCIELQGFEISLVRWCNGTRQREVLVSEHLL